MEGDWEVGLVIMGYGEGLLSYGEGAEELGKWDDGVVEKRVKGLGEGGGVKYVKGVSVDGNLREYG